MGGLREQYYLLVPLEFSTWEQIQVKISRKIKGMTTTRRRRRREEGIPYSINVQYKIIIRQKITVYFGGNRLKSLNLNISLMIIPPVVTRGYGYKSRQKSINEPLYTKQPNIRIPGQFVLDLKLCNYQYSLWLQTFKDICNDQISTRMRYLTSN